MYNEKCIELKRIAEKLTQSLDGLQMLSESNQIRAIIQRLLDEPFRVLVIGEFSRGKSTFINALIGEKVLPSSVRPTTAVISIIRNGPERQAVAFWRDKSKPPETLHIPEEKPSKALDLLTAKNESAMEIEKVVITLPIPLHLPVEIVDTPGVNDIDSQREEITYSYLARADAAIMLLDLQQPISASEKHFLTEKVLKNDVNKIIFLINKIDQSTPEMRKRSIDYVRKCLEEIPTISNPRIFPVASKLALQGKENADEQSLLDSMFPQFEQGLHQFLIEASGLGRIATAAQRLVRFGSQTITYLSELQENIQGQQSQIQASAKETEKKQQRLLELEQQIEGDIHLELARFVDVSEARLKQRLQQLEIEASSLFNQPDFPSEPSIEMLRSTINQATRDLISLPSAQAQQTASLFMRKYGEQNKQLLVTQPIDAPPVELRPTLSSSDADDFAGIGGTIGGILGGALLGIVGGIPLAILGGWIAAQFAPPPGNQIRQQFRSTINTLRSQAHQALIAASGELKNFFIREILEQKRQELQRERQKHQILLGNLHSDATTKAQWFNWFNQHKIYIETLMHEIQAIGEAR